MTESAPNTASVQDDERTQIHPNMEIAALTSRNAQQTSSLFDSCALSVGTRLGEYEITGMIGKGGFGIVYLAYDHSLHRKVALKEYMPSSMATRTDGKTISLLSARHGETFQAGLRSFINEAQLLAQFDHPSLIKVYRFWEENGTAYMAMPFYEGITLKQALQQRSAPPDEAWLRHFLSEILDALEVIHAKQWFHRDISPDNILMLDENVPLLLDFGAARRVIGDMTHAPTAILKPGYAPLEQYADIPDMKQGAWTDLYALASVVYMAITGKVPTPAVARAVADPLEPLAKLAAGRYGTSLLCSIDAALAVLPENRPQSVRAFRDLLDRENTTQQQKQQQQSSSPRTIDHTRQSPEPMSVALPTLPHKRNTTRYAIAGAILTATVVGSALWLHQNRSTTPDAAATTATTPAVTTPVAATSAAATLPTTVPTTVPPTLATTSTSVSTPETAVSKPPFDPAYALDEIFQDRNRQHAVAVSTENAQVRIGKDPLRFTIRSSRPGYVYVLMLTADRSAFYLLFPNAVDKDNRIKSDKEMQLPRAGWRMIADGPPGTDHFVVMVSESPREFKNAGLKNKDPFSEFPLAAAARDYAAYSGKTPLFAGKATCPPTANGACSDSFGAASFSIEEIIAPR